MSSLRRLGALLSSLLLLQLTLLSGGWSCVMHEPPTGNGHGAMAMAHASHGAVRGHQSHDGCDTERLPGDCASMPTCATTLAMPETVAASVTEVAVAATMAEPASIGSQPAAAPDAPPPRG